MTVTVTVGVGTLYQIIIMGVEDDSPGASSYRSREVANTSEHQVDVSPNLVPMNTAVFTRNFRSGGVTTPRSPRRVRSPRKGFYDPCRRSFCRNSNIFANIDLTCRPQSGYQRTAMPEAFRRRKRCRIPLQLFSWLGERAETETLRAMRCYHVRSYHHRHPPVLS